MDKASPTLDTKYFMAYRGVMRAWLARLLGVDRPPPPRVGELAARLSDVETELEKLDARLKDALKAINARITNRLRQDAPQETIVPPPEVGPHGTVYPPVRRIRRNY